jgi:hypothetical protein
MILIHAKLWFLYTIFIGLGKRMLKSSAETERSICAALVAGDFYGVRKGDFDLFSGLNFADSRLVFGCFAFKMTCFRGKTARFRQVASCHAVQIVRFRAY